MAKKRIMLDITPLQYGFFQNSARSGIYFTLKNVLLQLLNRKDVDLFFNLDLGDAPNVELEVHTVLEREFSEYRAWILSRTFSEIPSRLRVFCDSQDLKIRKGKERFRNNPLIFFLLRCCFFLVNRILRPLDRNFPVLKLKNVYYLSLMLAPPEYIKAQIRPELRYLLLYDTIPLSIPEYASQMSGWFGNVAKSIIGESHYMAISKATRNDFVHFFPVLEGKEIPIVDLAAADYFRPVRDEKKQNAVRAKYHIPKDKKIFFSHCSLAPHKNLETLFRAFAEFHKTDPNWIMLFSGANIGEKMERIKQLAKEKELPEDAFSFTGYVEDEELPVLYSIADVFCFVSLHEGFGLPVLEAMQCGCPCMVSNLSSLPEVVGDAACMVDPKNLDDIVRGLRTIAADPELRRELSRKGLERAKNFSWEKAAGQIVSAIR